MEKLRRIEWLGIRNVWSVECSDCDGGTAESSFAESATWSDLPGPVVTAHEAI